MEAVSGLGFTAVEGQLIVRCAIPAPRPALDLAGLQALLAHAGFARWPLGTAALSELVRRWGQEPEAFEMTLAQAEDASFSIEVDRHGQEAWVSVRPAAGGAPLKLGDLLQGLADIGVVHGIDTAALVRACELTEPQKLLVAKASQPVHGEDARFELLVDDARSRAPKVDEHGHIDFHELGDIPMVKADQALMRRHPATAGTPGRTVMGVAIPAKPGKAALFDTKLTGAAVDPQDPHLLRAQIAGQPVHTDSGVCVEPVLRLRRVNVASGNIRYDGTVEVAEDVAPGFKIQATGDIVVKGLVEGAEITSEGHVQVGGGIIAKSVVRAAQTVTARFAESAEIHAGAVIAITDTAVHCTLESGNQIQIGSPENPRARLVGGVARATMLIQVPTLGASASGVTRVQVGVSPELDRRLQELEAQQVQLKAEEDKLSKVVKHLSAHGDPRGMLPALKATWQQVLGRWGECMAERNAVEAQLALTQGASVAVGQGVGGDIDLQFGKVLRRVRRSLGAGRFSMGDDGQVTYTDPSGTVVPLT